MWQVLLTKTLIWSNAHHTSNPQSLESSILHTFNSWSLVRPMSCSWFDTGYTEDQLSKMCKALRPLSKMLPGKFHWRQISTSAFGTLSLSSTISSPYSPFCVIFYSAASGAMIVIDKVAKLGQGEEEGDNSRAGEKGSWGREGRERRHYFKTATPSHLKWDICFA